MRPDDWTPAQLDSLAGLKVLVVGDVILDRYVHGRADRVSPEAPVLVLEFEREDLRLGGAGNVVQNLCAAGAKVALCGLVGQDDNGRRVREMLRGLGASVGGLLADASRPTIQKTRVMAAGQQILRVDREQRHALSDAMLARIARQVEREAPRCAGIILSDYAKGLLTPELIGRVVEIARGAGLRVVADPKGSDYHRYRGVDYLKPNLKETQIASGVAIDGPGSLETAARILLRLTQGQGIVISRGSDGCALFRRRARPFYDAGHTREVFDVTGAGDTFISYFALALFAGASPDRAAMLGNLAGGLAVERVGAAPVGRDELAREITEMARRPAGDGPGRANRKPTDADSTGSR